MPGAEPGERLIDLCGVPDAGFEQRADAVIDVVLRGQSVTLLTDSDAVVRYVLPSAVARGAQCRFAPPQNGVWRVDLAPGEPPADPPPEGVIDIA
ncbi:MAG: hypothetical protein WEB13_07980 [Dehalococcoidia bacterium]